MTTYDHYDHVPSPTTSLAWTAAAMPLTWITAYEALVERMEIRM